jgi:hypothetical protein
VRTPFPQAAVRHKRIETVQSRIGNRKVFSFSVLRQFTLTRGVMMSIDTINISSQSSFGDLSLSVPTSLTPEMSASLTAQLPALLGNQPSFDIAQAVFVNDASGRRWSGNAGGMTDAQARAVVIQGSFMVPTGNGQFVELPVGWSGADGKMLLLMPTNEVMAFPQGTTTKEIENFINEALKSPGNLLDKIPSTRAGLGSDLAISIPGNLDLNVSDLQVPALNSSLVSTNWNFPTIGTAFTSAGNFSIANGFNLGTDPNLALAPSRLLSLNTFALPNFA